MKKIIAFIAGFTCTTVLIAVVFVFGATVVSPDAYTVLFVGSDQRGSERARSDVMFLVSIPKDADAQPYFLTIPRDTKVEDETWGLQKMTHFYAMGDRPDDGKVLGNIELTRGEIEELLGIEVDATVEVTFSSFEEVVDTLGGANVAGEQVDGAAALAMVRDRFTGGRSDFDRQADAREILRSLVTKVKDPARVRLLMDYFDDSQTARLEYDKTKLLRFLVGAGIARRGDVSIGAMEEGALPGTSARIYTPDFGKELYYWVIDEEATATLVEEHF